MLLQEHRETSSAGTSTIAGGLRDATQRRGRAPPAGSWPVVELEVPGDATPECRVNGAGSLTRHKDAKVRAVFCEEADAESSAGFRSVIESHSGSFYASLMREQRHPHKTRAYPPPLATPCDVTVLGESESPREPSNDSQGCLPAHDAGRMSFREEPPSTLKELLVWRQELIQSRLDAQFAQSPDGDGSRASLENQALLYARSPVLPRSRVVHKSLPASPCRGHGVTAATVTSKVAASVPCRLPPYAADMTLRYRSPGTDASSPDASANASLAALSRQVSAGGVDSSDEDDHMSSRFVFFIFMLLFLVFLLGAPLFLDGLFMLF